MRILWGMTPGREAATRAAVSRRGELRLRQSDLAAESGVSERAIQKFEAGETWPWAANRAAIARALGRPATWLDDIAAEVDAATSRPKESPSLPVPPVGADRDAMLADLEARIEALRQYVDEIRRSG